MLARLQQAEAAYQRCKGLLPSAWTQLVKRWRDVALLLRPWLLELQQSRGREWVRPSPAVAQKIDAAGNQNRGDPMRHGACSGCGLAAAQLRLCGSCKEARYCR